MVQQLREIEFCWAGLIFIHEVQFEVIIGIVWFIFIKFTGDDNTTHI